MGRCVGPRSSLVAARKLCVTCHSSIPSEGAGNDPGSSGVTIASLSISIGVCTSVGRWPSCCPSAELYKCGTNRFCVEIAKLLGRILALNLAPCRYRTSPLRSGTSKMPQNTSPIGLANPSVRSLSRSFWYDDLTILVGDPIDGVADPIALV